MYDLTNKELKSIIGGINITAAFINGVKGIFSIFYDFGNSLGSSIRRIKEKKIKELLKNKVVKVVFVIIILVLSTFIMNYLFNLGINFGTFIRKLIELTSC